MILPSHGIWPLPPPLLCCTRSHPRPSLPQRSCRYRYRYQYLVWSVQGGQCGSCEGPQGCLSKPPALWQYPQEVELRELRRRGADLLHNLLDWKTIVAGCSPGLVTNTLPFSWLCTVMDKLKSVFINTRSKVSPKKVYKLFKGYQHVVQSFPDPMVCPFWLPVIATITNCLILIGRRKFP